MELAVINKSGQETGRTVSLPDSVFGVTPNDHVIYLAVKHYRANKRQGTHKAKERAEITGSTRKIKKQKGTGTARAGSIKSPVFRGGGRVFGPRPRTYDSKLNKKEKALARNSALTYKAQESSIKVLETLSFDAPKTKDFTEVLKSAELNNSKTLLVLGEDNKNVYLSARNIQNANVVSISSLNTYDILHADQLIISEDAVEKFANFAG
jgi:large subunit ribosomal protein L4